MGDSRGRWEGGTLVVDTTNFTDKTSFRGSTSGLHLIERFTRVDADTLRYEVTVDDPATWTRTWTAALAMPKTNGGIYEYACHEGELRYGEPPHRSANPGDGLRRDGRAALVNRERSHESTVEP